VEDPGTTQMPDGENEVVVDTPPEVADPTPEPPEEPSHEGPQEPDNGEGGDEGAE
jgi:hypothetical protein